MASGLPRATIDDIELLHAKQLANFTPREATELPPGSEPPQNYLRNTLDWIEANPKALQAARDARKIAFMHCLMTSPRLRIFFPAECSSESPASPNWNTVFFALVESSAVYNRRVFTWISQ